MRWVDTHVHIFSSKDANKADAAPFFPSKILHTADVYLQAVAANKPEGIVVVDLSKAKTSEHVINSLDDLKSHKIKVAGIIKGVVNDTQTQSWLERPDVAGVRFYALADVPDLSSQAHHQLFNRLAQLKKHILVFGKGKNLLALLRQMPENVPVLIDHLGMADVFSAQDSVYDEILAYIRPRKHIHVKGPGHRVAIDPARTTSLVKKIADTIGIQRFILGASDGPFAGPVLDTTPRYAGKMFGDVITYSSALESLSSLAAAITSNAHERDALLCDNAKKIYGF